MMEMAGFIPSEQEDCISLDSHTSGETNIRIEGGTEKRISSRSFFALERWLSEDLFESPWSVLRLSRKAACQKRSNLYGKLDAILTQYQGFDPFKDANRRTISTQYQSPGTNDSFIVALQTRETASAPASALHAVNGGTKGAKIGIPFNFDDQVISTSQAESSKQALKPSANSKNAGAINELQPIASHSHAYVSAPIGQLQSPSQTHANFQQTISFTQDGSDQLRPQEDLGHLRDENCNESYSEASTSLHSTMLSSFSTVATSIQDLDDLQSHINAYYAVLIANGICPSTKAGSTGDVGSDPPMSLVKDDGSCVPTGSSSRTGNSKEVIGKRTVVIDSEDENRSPDKRRRKLAQNGKTANKVWACPFAKFNIIEYARCETWSVQTIENVKRHVLGTRHVLSQDMISDIKRRLGRPFSTPEARWKELYMTLFGVDEHLVPCPYYGVDNTSTVAVTSSTNISEVIDESEVPVENEATIMPQNPHAAAFATQALRLQEQFEQRLNLQRLEAVEARRRLDEATDLAERRLSTELMQDLGRLHSRFLQGLPPDAIDEELLSPRAVPQISPEATTHIPAPFEATTHVSHEHQAPRYTLEEIMASHPTQASTAGDSGYGTMSEDTACSCPEPWCLKCYTLGLDSFFCESQNEV